jgi:hypothetical protein
MLRAQGKVKIVREKWRVGDEVIMFIETPCLEEIINQEPSSCNIPYLDHETIFLLSGQTPVPSVTQKKWLT